MMPPLRGLFCVAPLNRILLFYNFSFSFLNQHIHTGELLCECAIKQIRKYTKKTDSKKTSVAFR